VPFDPGASGTIRRASPGNERPDRRIGRSRGSSSQMASPPETLARPLGHAAGVWSPRTDRTAQPRRPQTTRSDEPGPWDAAPRRAGRVSCRGAARRPSARLVGSVGDRGGLALGLELVDDAPRDSLGEDDLAARFLDGPPELAGPDVLEQGDDCGRPRLPFGREALDGLLVEEAGDVADDRVEVTVFVVVEVVELEDPDLAILALSREDHVNDADEPGVDEALDLCGRDAREPVAGVSEDEQLDGPGRHRGPPTDVCAAGFQAAPRRP